MSEHLPGEPIENLPNLGPRSSQWLRDAGIHTIDELRRLGPVLAFKIVKQRQVRASLNLLWGIAAGLQNRDWRELSPVYKEQLRRALEDL